MEKTSMVAAETTAAFAALVDRFAALAADEGVSVVAYRGDEPKFFPMLPPPMQSAVLENFRRYLNVAERTRGDGSALSEERQFLWQMFRELGVHPPSDLMARIARSDDEVVEIYDANFVQVFRNLRFFRQCSYSLDELLSLPFWQLFHREASVTERILAVATEYFSGQRRDVHAWDLGRHTIEEISAPMRYRSVVEQKLVSPLFDGNGRIHALLNTIREVSTVALATDGSAPPPPKRPDAVPPVLRT